jgi:hypothetical protein
MRHMLDHAKEAVDLLAGKEKADLVHGYDAPRTVLCILGTRFTLNLAPCTVNRSLYFRHFLHDPFQAIA